MQRFAVDHASRCRLPLPLWTGGAAVRCYYAAKPKDTYNTMKEQRINSFRWQDHNRWKPHRKYDADPTMWNREEREKQRNVVAQRVAADALLAAALASPGSPGAVSVDSETRSPLHTADELERLDSAALALRFDTFDMTQFHSRVLVPLASLVPDTRAAAELHRLTTLLRNPSALRTGVTLAQVAARFPEALGRLTTDLAALPSSAVSGFLSKEGLTGALALSDVTNDFRLAIAGLQQPQGAAKDLLVGLCAVLEDFVRHQSSSPLDGEQTAMTLRILGNIVLARAESTSAVIALTKSIMSAHVAAGTTLTDVALENFAAAIAADAVMDEHVPWLMAVTEGSLRYWLQRTKLVDSTAVWGNIVPRKTSPIPPHVPRLLCATVRHAIVASIRASRETVALRRLSRLSEELVSLIALTPNHALPLRQVTLLAHTIVHRLSPHPAVNGADAVGSHFRSWIEVLSRFNKRCCLLSSQELLMLIDVCMSEEVVKAAGSVAAASHAATSTVHHALLALEGSLQDVPADQIAGLCRALAVRHRGHVTINTFQLCVSKASGADLDPALRPEMIAALVALRSCIQGGDRYCSPAFDKQLLELVASLVPGAAEDDAADVAGILKLELVEDRVSAAARMVTDRLERGLISLRAEG